MILPFLAMMIAPATPACQPPANVEQLTSSTARHIVIGEIHGTEQAPAAFGEIVCAFAVRNERLLVALELSVEDDQSLRSAWSKPTARFSEALRTMKDWSTREDGVASRAVFDLLIRLHALKTAGRRIDVTAFNGTRDEAQAAYFKTLPGQGPHEAAQADNIQRAAARGRYDRVLVLVGNVHARKKPVERRGISFEPMAMRLAPPADLLSLNIADAGGSAWNCQLKAGFQPEPGQPIGADAIQCIARPTKGYSDLSGPARILRSNEAGEAQDDAYDAVLWIGQTTASPPVGSQKR